MLLAAVIALIFTSLVAVLAVFTAGFLYGKTMLLAKMTVEAKRRERDLTKRSELYETKLLERSGLGPLRRREFTDTGQKPIQNHVVSPSQVKARMTATVPPAIREEFITAASPASTNN